MEMVFMLLWAVVYKRLGLIVFFFFQAEDGIRDKLVTGVQTCALPISGDPVRVRSALLHVGRSSMRLLHVMTNERSGERVATLEQLGVHLDIDARRPTPRSEERRVGKECRSRWSPYH